MRITTEGWLTLAALTGWLTAAAFGFMWRQARRDAEMMGRIVDRELGLDDARGGWR